jgi:hypothetical protein
MRGRAPYTEAAGFQVVPVRRVMPSWVHAGQDWCTMLYTNSRRIAENNIATPRSVQT